MTKKVPKPAIKMTQRTVTRTIDAMVYEIPLTTILTQGSIAYEQWEDEGDGFSLAVGNDCCDTFVGIFVEGKMVKPEDVMIVMAEEVEV